MNNYQSLDFNDTNLYIGINIHKKNWEVAIRCNGMQIKYFNMEASTNHLIVAADPAFIMKFNQLHKTMSRQKAIIHIAKKLLSRMRYIWIN